MIRIRPGTLARPWVARTRSRPHLGKTSRVRPKITVVGGAGLVEKLGERDYADVSAAADGDAISGSDVVVLAEPRDELFGDIRERAPNAVVVSVGHSPAAVCEATLFPRARIIGVGDEAAAADLIAAIVLDRD